MTGLSESHALARVGHVTASRLHDITAKLKNGSPAQSREDYLIEKVIERRTGQPCESGFINKEMQYGIDNEHLALGTYALTTLESITRVEFIKHPTIPWAGASPDALVGNDGLVQIKIPKSATHYRLLTGRDKIKPEWLTQILWEIACTGRSWGDFYSFDPRQVGSDCEFRQRIWRREYEDRILQLETIVRQFNAEVEAEVNAAKARG